ncbi:phospholipase D family protein [Pseudomonas aeruginosa]|uniref:phospholipase D family protein n=1 Tax=Pseudomonas aeruginosa TaxID=287 RepID=UPI002E2DC9CA|nr:phospholipase D family protein [Pseudomonas aeruginosa]
MFLDAKNYLSQLEGLISSSRSLSVAVAFWGKGAENLFAGWSGDNLRILCNLGMGGTNPTVVERLLKLAQTRKGISILALDTLHAKVVLGDRAAIVGSANCSANGLGFEQDECDGWQEAGLKVEAPEALASIETWLEGLWDLGNEITEQRLEAARIAWDRNRKGRPKRTAVTRLIEVPLEELMDRPIYFAIYRAGAGPQAREVAMKAKQEAKCSDEASVRNAKLDFFDNWPDDGEESLPKDAAIIIVRYGSRKAVNVYNAWQRIPQLDETYISNETGEVVPVPILGKLDSVLGWSLSRADQTELAQRLKPWIEHLYSHVPGSDEARCLRFDEFLRWENEALAS